ncbi:MAG: glycoside hydrolase [Myxococcota bacterium]|nr:glycoside hydrolase [Myxococcota bacterium]
MGTARGELCMARCERDADCRASEGYVCDRVWKACVMPNATAIVPRTCPTPRGIGRDTAFAPTTALVDANQAASAIAGDGRVVTVHAALFGPAARDPSLAHAGGVFFAAWSGGGVMFATSKDGASWSTPVKLDDSDGRPIVVAGGGAIHVLFAHEGMRVRTSRDGGKTFGAARTILAGGSGNATLGADGRLHVAAIDGSPLGAFGSANQRIQYTNGGKPVTVSRRDEMLPFYFANPSVAVDSRRKWIYVAYVRGGRDAVWDLVLAASKDGGATWTRTRIGDDPPCAIHMVPNLALDPTTGTLHIAWYDSRGDKPRFAHATCAPGLAKCTQVGRINDVPLATLSTVRNNATWIGDYETLVVDDKRRTLHAVWTQPVDEAGKIVSRVFHAKAKLPLR